MKILRLILALIALPILAQKAPKTVGTIAELVSLPPATLAANYVGTATNFESVVIVQGQSSPNDGLGASWTWSSTSTAATNTVANGGPLAAPYGAATGRWFVLNQSISIQGIQSSQFLQGFALPLPAGRGLSNYWAFGDSQTVGQMGVTLVTNWTDTVGSISRIKSQFRYPDIIASKFGLNLTNAAFSGSGLRWTSAFDYGRQGPINRMGEFLPLDWKGLVSVMVGYNDAGAEYSTTEWNRHFLNAAMATYGRALITDYVANGTNGYGVRYAGWNPGGATVVTNYCDPAGCFPTNNAFPMGQWGTANRIYTAFQLPGDYLTIQSTNHSNVLVFYQTSQGSGEQWVMVGTNVVGTIFAETPDPRDYENFCAAFLIRNIPSGVQNLTVTNISGYGRVFAFGFLPELPASTDRTLIVATPFELFSADRSASTLNAISRAELRAATLLADWNVAFADTQNSIDVVTDMLPASGDINHPTPSGQAHAAYTIQVAKRASQNEIVGAPWAALPPAVNDPSGSFTSIVNTGQLRNNGFIFLGTGNSTQPNPGILNQRATNGSAFIDYYTGPYAVTNLDWRINYSSSKNLEFFRGDGTGGFSDAPLSLSRSDGSITMQTPALSITGSAFIGSTAGSHGISLIANRTNIAFLDFDGESGTAGTYFRFARNGNTNFSLILSSNNVELQYIMNVPPDGSGIAFVTPTFFVSGNGLFTGSLQANGAFTGQTNGTFYGNLTLGNSIASSGVLIGAGYTNTAFLDLNSGATNSYRIARDPSSTFYIARYSNNVQVANSLSISNNGDIQTVGKFGVLGTHVIEGATYQRGGINYLDWFGPSFAYYPTVNGGVNLVANYGGAGCSYALDTTGFQIGVAASVPATPGAGGILYVDPADNKLKYKGSSGTVTIIANP